MNNNTTATLDRADCRWADEECAELAQAVCNVRNEVQTTFPGVTCRHPASEILRAAECALMGNQAKAALILANVIAELNR